MADTAKPRPQFRNIHVSQIVAYRLPPAGIVSILHRISGAVLFLLLPFIIWLFDVSVSSEASFERFRAAFTAGLGFLPGW
ncbi:MAG: succinate dehydrogenase, cytochrome b556 subunit, partial [Rubrivivax sp.]